MQDRQLGDHSIEKHLNAFCAVVLDLKMATSNHNVHVLVLSLSHTLVPRPFCCLVFDHLQCAKMEGEEGLVLLSCE